MEGVAAPSQGLPLSVVCYASQLAWIWTPPNEPQWGTPPSGACLNLYKTYARACRGARIHFANLANPGAGRWGPYV